MNATSASPDTSAAEARFDVPKDAFQPASKHAVKGATRGLELIFWLLEQRLVTLLAMPTLIALLATLVLRGDWVTFAIAWLAVPLLFVFLPM